MYETRRLRAAVSREVRGEQSLTVDGARHPSLRSCCAAKQAVVVIEPHRHGGRKQRRTGAERSARMVVEDKNQHATK